MEKSEKQIILNVEKLETRVALLNSGKLEEYQIERVHDGPKVGSIYLTRIMNLEISLHAAFVDIGNEKNAFLHYWDMLPLSYEYEQPDAGQAPEPVEESARKTSGIAEKLRSCFASGRKSCQFREREKLRRQSKMTIQDIPELYPARTELLVQVSKGPIGVKGARVTTNITIPGRYLVLLPYSNHIGLSSKIENRQERTRLKKILQGLDIPEGMGVICRTVGEGRKSIYFKRDLDMLLDYWRQVEEKIDRCKAPTLVYSEPTLVERTARDFMTEEIDGIVVDDSAAHKQIHDSLKKFGGQKMAVKVSPYRKAVPIFEHFGVENQLEAIYQRVAPLPSGGHICIDETEALIAIDVNTGKGKRTGEHPEVMLETNLEAASEIARQLRLRNIGGIVVIDFIDMRQTRDRDTLYKHMRKLVREDRARTSLSPVSKFGLMEMTRQRENESLINTVYDQCPYCNGRGKVKSPLTMSAAIQRRLNTVLRDRSKQKMAVRVIMHPEILARLKNEDAGLLTSLESKYGRNLSFRADDGLHHEEFRLVDPETNTEL